jgi:PTH1 family peptidyl-tRNA hydrolase
MVIGLGNPGSQYKNTRHNIGFLILDRLAELLGVAFTKEKYKGHIAEAQVNRQKVLLLKPMTFMNKSGESAAQAARNRVNDSSEVLTVYDDVDLSLGKLRIRKNGSAGTHNGMKSIIEYLGTKDVPRLRVGIGANSGKGDLSAHVLGKFHPDEFKTVDEVIEQATQAILAVLNNDIDSAMNEFNKN